MYKRQAHHLYGKNTGKYYEIDFRPQDLHDCIYDDFDGDPLAAVEAYFAEVEKVAAMPVQTKVGTSHTAFSLP